MRLSYHFRTVSTECNESVVCGMEVSRKVIAFITIITCYQYGCILKELVRRIIKKEMRNQTPKIYHMFFVYKYWLWLRYPFNLRLATRVQHQPWLATVALCGIKRRRLKSCRGEAPKRVRTIELRVRVTHGASTCKLFSHAIQGGIRCL